MNDEQYLQHCNTLIAGFADQLAAQTEQLPGDDPLAELARGFAELAATDADVYGQGPILVARLFTTYPELAPLLPRQLLWFFGGDCLHYMPDEEIEIFQRLEDMRAQAADNGQTLDLEDARAKLLKLK